MESDMEDKQSYLRKQILKRGYDPQKFIQFLDARLHIGDDLSLCSFQQLKIVVNDFVQFEKSNAEQSEYVVKEAELPESMLKSQVVEKSGMQKPRLVLFDKFNFTELEFSKKYSCVRVSDRHQIEGTIHCEVCNANRKTVGGFFGIGTTSFLQFEVRTLELNWVTGRRYSDFVWLRTHLRKMYPTQIVPPIPQKKAAKRTQRHVQKRMKILTFFLNDLMSIHEFRNNKIVEGFLKIKDGAKFTQMKEDGDKMKPTDTVNHVQTESGEITVNFSLENKAYMEEMKRCIPDMEKLYKQITRQGKALQAIQTDEVNILYEMGNLFAELHQKSRQVLNRVPKATGLFKINQLYVTLNNMTIEWGNLLRNQFQIIENNFNTFFKYIRNDLHGYFELFDLQTAKEEEFGRLKLALDKKKDRIYNLFDACKWELPKEMLVGMSKDVVHDKAKAFKLMLPKQSKDLEHLRVNNALFISQLFENGSRNLHGSAQKFKQNFKEWSINLKVNTQQVVQLWSQMSQSFSGERGFMSLKEKPLDLNRGDQIMDD